MPKWVRKSFVILVTILTFGMVTPSQVFLYDGTHSGKSTKRDSFESNPAQTAADFQFSEDIRQPLSDREVVVEQIMKEAKEQSMLKFGSKIKPCIEDEFQEIILPEMEKAIDQVISGHPEEDLMNLAITEAPGNGKSEKIFHIFDRITKKDILRFHVRRDHPPQAGFWFNFHYHTHHDQFQAHHDLGTIYWDKNTPPKWMS
ncbi:hypothetical protein CVD25_06685 [Bacillus canaveralius]|uniref:Cell division protein FtsK n=1 Tax=Bacillus canaveralius TaxID=1403243 RepID=A0A2N5GJ28_9BACI|nr:YpjP family protein [Bacillus canaveralius]PLR81066.1 hypothetical protein CU635_16270 [Bacillus canaveralius]PLR98960.1 hypothetical protein CVD25_06685 [Bacillus canaveralius]